IRFGVCMNSDPAAKQKKAPDPAANIWFRPAIFAPIGASSAAALLLEADAETLNRTWGIAVSTCPMTPRGVLSHGATSKGMYLGLGCGNGVLSADMAAAGLTGMQGADITDLWMNLAV